MAKAAVKHFANVVYDVYYVKLSVSRLAHSRKHRLLVFVHG